MILIKEATVQEINAALLALKKENDKLKETVEQLKEQISSGTNN